MFDEWIKNKVDRVLASKVKQLEEMEKRIVSIDTSLDKLKKRLSEVEEDNARIERFCNENYKLANDTHEKFDDMILDAMSDLRTYVDGVEAGIKLDVRCKKREQ